jgi:hypothetical protein
MKKLEYSVGHKYEVTVSETMSGTVWETFTIQKRNIEVTLPTEPLYKDLMPIKSTKREDVKKLCKYIKQEFQAVIASLRAVNDTKDDSDD